MSGTDLVGWSVFKWIFKKIIFGLVGLLKNQVMDDWENEKNKNIFSATKESYGYKK